MKLLITILLMSTAAPLPAGEIDKLTEQHAATQCLMLAHMVLRPEDATNIALNVKPRVVPIPNGEGIRLIGVLYEYRTWNKRTFVCAFRDWTSGTLQLREVSLLRQDGSKVNKIKDLWSE